VFAVIYPMMVNLKLEALVRAGRNVRGLVLATFYNFRQGRDDRGPVVDGAAATGPQRRVHRGDPGGRGRGWTGAWACPTASTWPYLYCRQREIIDALADLGPVHQLGQLTRSIVEHLAGKPARCSPSGPGWRPAGGSARDATSVAQVQADLGVGWGTVMRAVREYATSAYW